MMPPYMSVKMRQTTTPGTTCPTVYEECVGSLTFHRFITCARACETGPSTVYRPYPRRLESQTVCRCYYKGSTFSSVIGFGNLDLDFQGHPTGNFEKKT